MNIFFRLLFSTSLLFLLPGCTPKAGLMVFKPADNLTDITYFFHNGYPIGSYESDEEFILFSIEETKIIGSTAYLKIWLLYENNSDSRYLLEPYNLIKLEAASDKLTAKELLAESPKIILQKVDQKKEGELIWHAIGGVLSSLASQDSYEQRAALRETRDDMIRTEYWYESFKNSINTGVLRKHTVFPNESVNGFIYFPMKDLKTTLNNNKLSITIQLHTKSGVKKIPLETVDVW
jgi:hypothetical protein